MLPRAKKRTRRRASDLQPTIWQLGIFPAWQSCDQDQTGNQPPHDDWYVYVQSNSKWSAKAPVGDIEDWESLHNAALATLEHEFLLRHTKHQRVSKYVYIEKDLSKKTSIYLFACLLLTNLRLLMYLLILFSSGDNRMFHRTSKVYPDYCTPILTARNFGTVRAQYDSS